jgi:hypothetical protein
VTTSQNGWPVDTSGAKQDRAPLIRDIVVPNGVLAGDVAAVFRWLAAEYDAKVERLVAGTCWGWFVKPIEGGSSVSNHASGTAVDFNADRHPMGQAPTASFSSKQIAACRAIVAAAGGVLRWGGDYSGRKDGMHWEINASAAAVKAFAKKIGDDVDDDDMDKIADKVVAKLMGYQVTDNRPEGQQNASGKRAFSSAVVYGPAEAADRVIAELPTGA